MFLESSSTKVSQAIANSQNMAAGGQSGFPYMAIVWFLNFFIPDIASFKLTAMLLGSVHQHLLSYVGLLEKHGRHGGGSFSLYAPPKNCVTV